MFDVCFSSSIGGHLLALKSQLGNSIKSDGILTLNFMFNYGHLSGNVFERQARIQANVSKAFYAEITEEELNSFYEEELDEIQFGLSELDERLKSGEDIRLWTDDSAKERCGLYWLCDYVKDYPNKVYVVRCPGYDLDLCGEHFTENRSWASFSNLPYMASFAESAIELPRGVIQLYSKLWVQMVKEDQPLRVVIDGKVVSTSEDFFDNALLEFITDEPQTQNHIMGSFLGKWQCGYVSFLCERIEFFLEQGLVEVVENNIDEAGCFWQRTIRKRNAITA